MKNLLNNPKFVLPLATCAFAYVGLSTLAPLLSEHNGTPGAADIPAFGFAMNDEKLPISKRIDTQIFETLKEATDFDSQTNESLREISAIGWVRKPARDPFRFADTAGVNLEDNLPLESEPPSQEPAQHSPALSRAIDVNAVVIGPSFKIAVVDGQLVHEGQSMPDGRLHSVTASGVSYQAPDGALTLLPLGDTKIARPTQ